MPKYMRVFDTHEAYELWTAGKDYMAPSVAVCLDVADVHYQRYIKYVDLGLPSGTLWAECNINAVNNSPFDPGLWCAWGENTGITTDQIGVSRNFNPDTYKWFDGNSITKYNKQDNKVLLDAEDDIATVSVGNKWKLPNLYQVYELDKYTTKEYNFENHYIELTSVVNGNKMYLPLPGYIEEDNGKDMLVEGDDTYMSGAYLLDSLSQSRSKSIFAGANYLALNIESGSTPYPLMYFTIEAPRFVGVNARAVTSLNYEYVDLGLPSGRLWSTKYIGADSSSSSGIYFQFAVTNGIDSSIVDSELNTEMITYADDNYYWYDGSEFTKYTDADGLETMKPIDDPATIWLGKGWSTPTQEMFEELLEYCETVDYVEREYIELESTVNGNRIRFANVGDLNYSSNENKNKISDDYEGKFCMVNGISNNGRSSLYFSISEGELAPNYVGGRSTGYNVRAVYTLSANDESSDDEYPMYVDMGLPSGNLWATCNLGSDDPYIPGLYYAWGDLSGYTADQVGVNKNFNDSDYIYGSHDALTKYNDTDGWDALAQSDDAAYDELGQTGNDYWHIPNPNDFEELLDNTDQTYDETHNCYILTSQINGKKLIMPLAGNADDGFINYRNDFGRYGAYWTNLLYYDGSVDITSAYAVYLNQKSNGGSLEQCYRFRGLQIRPVLSAIPEIPQ